MSYSLIHPLILSGKHPITSLLIRFEHRRHASPTLLTTSLNHRYYITGCREIVRSITRGCIACQRTTARSKHQLLGQIPSEPRWSFQSCRGRLCWTIQPEIQVSSQTHALQGLCLRICFTYSQGCSPRGCV